MALVIDLRTPLRGQWVGRGFGRHYSWTYVCAAGHRVLVRALAWRGKWPVPGVGAIVCPHCRLSDELQ